MGTKQGKDKLVAVDKKKFDDMVRKAGYRSRRQFAFALGTSAQSLENNLTGRFGLSVDRCIKMANGLQVPVDTIIKMFYPELFETNVKYQ